MALSEQAFKLPGFLNTWQILVHSAGLCEFPLVTAWGHLLVHWWQVSREAAKRICIYRKIYFKELTHTIMEAGKLHICRVGWQAGGPREERAELSSSPKAISCRISPAQVSLVLCSIEAFSRLDEALLHSKMICFTQSLLI
jgi:hypothetical protein